MTVDVVIPTVGRPSLVTLLSALDADAIPGRVHVVDDRRETPEPLVDGSLPPRIREVLCLHQGGGRGPAAARNRGWLCAGSEWVAFLDDDVVPEPGWVESLLRDVAAADDDVAGVQGRLAVPLPDHRPPTDWERNVAHLAGARWITADMAFRRSALEEVGGFDETFRRAYREDTDLALRLLDRGWKLVEGGRGVVHPVRPAGPWVSVRLQRGNSDDVLLTARHGRGWKGKVGESPGRRLRHAVVAAAGLVGIAGVVSGRRKMAIAGLAGWLIGTVEFAARRIGPGPRTPGEIATMAVTSVVIPPAAVYHWLSGAVAVVSGAYRPQLTLEARGDHTSPAQDRGKP